MRLVFGYDSQTHLKNKSILQDERTIRTKILDLWKDWKGLRETSQRPDRASKSSFMKKEENFVMNVLDMPFKILCRDYENNMSTAGITAWKEDLQHLNNQLERDQVGTCSGYDVRQKKKDNRKLKEMMRTSSAPASTMEEIEDDIEEEEGVDVDMEEDSEFVKRERRKITDKKVDVMG